MFDPDPPDDLCFIFYPNTDFNGQDVGQVVVCETITDGLCDTVTVIVDVTPVNDAPVIVDESFIPVDTIRIQINEDSTTIVCVNALDVEGVPGRQTAA